jgi:hypothetical protein
MANPPVRILEQDRSLAKPEAATETHRRVIIGAFRLARHRRLEDRPGSIAGRSCSRTIRFS